MPDYRNFDWIQKELHDRPTKKLDNNTYGRMEDGKVIIKLHATDIIVADEDGMTLYSGGYETPTTRDRLNNYLPNAVRVHQENNQWYVTWGNNWDERKVNRVRFVSGMRVSWDGVVTGGGKVDDAKAKKLLRRINAYAKAYAHKFITGEMSQPGAGDCIYCQFRDTATNKTLGDIGEHPTHDHLFSHMTEKYYVPSILYNIMMENTGRLSQVTLWAIQNQWFTDKKEEMGYINCIAEEQIAHAVARYLKDRLTQVEEPHEEALEASN